MIIIIIIRKDATLSKWSQTTRENIKLCDLPDQSYPIDLHLLPSTLRSTNKTSGIEQILITSSNGTEKKKIITKHKIYVIGKKYISFNR